MPDDSGEAVDRLITENDRIKTILTWIGGTFCILFVLSILATKLLPRPAGTTISSILLDIAVVLGVCVMPVLEAILWKLRKALPRNGYWGMLLLLAGLGIMLPVGTIVIFFSTFLPALSYPLPLLVAVLVVMSIAFALITLGLLTICIQVVWEILQLFRNMRQARIDKIP